MTKAQIDQAHRLVSELNIYADSAQQYGHGGMTAAMRNAAALLQLMVEEAEAAEMKQLKLPLREGVTVILAGEPEGA